MKDRYVMLILCIALSIPQTFSIWKNHESSLPRYAHTSTLSASTKLFLPIISKELPGFFVSPDGSDTNPGTYSLPWKTIRKATQMITAGDSVFIRDGIYNEYVAIYQSGTEVEPIVIQAFPGENPIIDGYGELPRSYTGLVSIYGDWVRVVGLEIRNSKYSGLGLYGKHNAADNIFAHHSQKSGIYISGDNGIVENSRVWRNSIQNEYGNSSSWSSGLVAARDSSDGLTEYAIMRNNIVWENWGQGINTYESNGTLMEDNISHDNFITNIYISDSTNVLCQRNFVYMTPTSYVFGSGPNVGIMIGDEVYTPPSANITVVNNISYRNNRNFALFTGLQDPGIDTILIANNTFVDSVETAGVILRGYHRNVRFENNITQQDDNLPVILVSLDPQIFFAYNLWSKVPMVAASGPGDIIADPQFAKTGEPYLSEWFRLTLLSPAIDQGKFIQEVIDDYFGNPRVGEPDIGAIEYYP
jgi:hypothetical protein